MLLNMKTGGLSLHFSKGSLSGAELKMGMDESMTSMDCHSELELDSLSQVSKRPRMRESKLSKVSMEVSTEECKMESRVCTDLTMRRDCIKSSLDCLQQLLPSDDEQRTSQASILHRTGSFITGLKSEHQLLRDEVVRVKEQMELLATEIESLKRELPEVAGESLCPNLSCMRPLSEQFDEHVITKDWRYFIFNHVLGHLANSFDNSVVAPNFQELLLSAMNWVNTHMALSQLRRKAFRKLAKLTRKTSILSSPSKLPEESRQALQQLRREVCSNQPP